MDDVAIERRGFNDNFDFFILMDSLIVNAWEVMELLI